MNLYDMLRRNDRNLIVSGDVAMAREVQDGETWRGLHMRPGSSFRIPKSRRFFSLRAWPDTCGWYVNVPDGLSLTVSFCDSKTDLAVATWEHTSGRKPVRLPWPKYVTDQSDLVVMVSGHGTAPLFLASQRALSRDWLINAAKGNGIEIGPGPQPQIISTPDVRVSYLEQMPPEEWNRLYNRGGKYPTRPELWDSYIVGDAADIPVADGSLDFIFSSHVFEHLANPLGHLIRWRDKLKPGGKILCVIPDLASTKDALQRPSTIAEWRSEQDADLWEPTPAHYVRYMHRAEDDPKIVQAIADRESIHVHYYTNTNCEQILSYACENLGFSSFAMNWTPNHKDFHFMLIKD